MEGKCRQEYLDEAMDEAGKTHVTEVLCSRYKWSLMTIYTKFVAQATNLAQRILATKENNDQFHDSPCPYGNFSWN